MEGLLLGALKLENVGPFKTLDLTFKRPMTVLVGRNAMGKTTILRSIVALWSNLRDPQLVPRTTYGRDQSLIKCDYFPTEEDVWNYSRAYKFPVDATSVHDVGVEYRKPDGSMGPSDNPTIYSPLIAINAYRRLEPGGVEGPKKGHAVSVNRAIQVHAGNFSTGNYGSIHQWLVNRYFSRYEDWAQRERREMEAFSNGLEKLFPSKLQVSFKSVNENYDPIFTTVHGTVPFNELSGGMQSVVHIVFSIIDGVSQIRRESENIFDEDALVLIDEIESHLHPEWQRTIVRGLTKMFPRCQFILTTHSPLIVSSCEPKEVVHLTQSAGDDGDGNGQIEARDFQSTKGWLAEDVLTDLMGVESSRPPEVQEMIDRLRELYRKRAEGSLIDRERDEIPATEQELEQLLPVDDPILITMKFDALRQTME